jgi:hypothetical protein
MNVRSIVLPPLVRPLLVATFLALCSGLSGCTTTDSTEDTTVYPTPAEKNREMQERMSDTSRSLM